MCADAVNQDGSFRVGLLGSLVFEVGGRSLGPGDLGGRKPKQVLEILLVHRGQPVAKDRIADLLWGAKLPRDPMRTLEAYVSVLRSRLDVGTGRARGVLRSEPGAYRLALEAAEVDLRRFDDLVSRAAAAPAGERLELRAAALALVRGELLADEPYAEWAMPLRDLYAERHLQLLLDAAQDCLEVSRPGIAAGYAEAVLRSQPTRERASRLLMAARYAMGEQDLALGAFDRCRRALASELGVSPSAETEQVYRAVLNQDRLDEILAGGPARCPAPVVSPARPRTRFARSGQATIAYQVVGDGDLDLVVALGCFSHVEVGWEEPRYAGFLRRLGRGRRLLLFDKRGVGMSDPAAPGVTLDERADDIRAVMDAAGSQRAVVFGISVGGAMAVSLAARAPARVSRLVLYSSFARLMASPDYPWGWSPRFLERYQASLEQAWMAGRGVERAPPAVTGDEALMKWVARYLRLSLTPATARALIGLDAAADIRGQLCQVKAPALVLHRRDEQWIGAGNGRYVAAGIPGSRFVELPGACHAPWVGDAETVLRPVEEFLSELAR